MRRIPINQTRLPSLPSVERRAYRRHNHNQLYGGTKNPSLVNSRIFNSKESLKNPKLNLNRKSRLDPLILDRASSGLYMSPPRNTNESSVES